MARSSGWTTTRHPKWVTLKTLKRSDLINQMRKVEDRVLYAVKRALRDAPALRRYLKLSPAQRAKLDASPHALMSLILGWQFPIDEVTRLCALHDALIGVDRDDYNRRALKWRKAQEQRERKRRA